MAIEADPPRRLLLLSSDLLALSRLEPAASSLGFSVAAASLRDAPRALAECVPDLVIVDLDQSDGDSLDALTGLAASGPRRVLGYFSHVDAVRGEMARRAGIEAFPRGRFWRSLHDLLSG